MTKDEFVSTMIAAGIDRDWAAQVRLRFFPDASRTLEDSDRSALLLRMVFVERVEPCDHIQRPYHEPVA